MDKAALIATLQAALPDLLAIYAFGSRITGTANQNSDLDLAVLTGGSVDTVKLWHLSSELAEIAGCDVDLLDMRSASTVMQYQILMTGERWWAKDVRAGLFECYVLSAKTELDTARAPLLKEIQEQGAVYGR